MFANYWDRLLDVNIENGNIPNQEKDIKQFYKGFIENESWVAMCEQARENLEINNDLY